jgi:hypothetical protein
MKIYYYTFVLFLVGCSSVYIPSPKNIPLFENKGEAQIETGVSTNSLYMTGSYAFSEKYAIIANGSISYTAIAGQYILPHGEWTFYWKGDVPHYSFEAGIGRYNLLPSSERKLELFAGAGYGMSAHNFTKYPNQNYKQGFIQLNTGKRYNYVEVGWSLRSQFSRFDNQHFVWYDNHEYGLEHEKYNAIHLEPMFVIRVGGQRVKWFYRCGINLAFPLSSNSIMKTCKIEGGYTLLHFSTGISYRL